MNELQYKALKQAVADRAKTLRQRIALAGRMKAQDRQLRWETEYRHLHEAIDAVAKAITIT